MNKIPTPSGIDAGAAASMSMQSSTLDRAKSLKDQEVKSKADIDKAAGGFEALLLQEMLQSMWSTVEFAGMFNEQGNEASIYRDMLNQAVADSASQGRGIGVKEFLSKELEKQNHASKQGVTGDRGRED